MMASFEIISYQEFRARYPQFAHQRYIDIASTPHHFCRAICMDDAVLGTIAIPTKNHPAEEKKAFGYLLIESGLILIDEQDALPPEAKKMLTGTPHLAFFELIEFFLKDDMPYLQRYEDRLSELEESLISGKNPYPNHSILRIRRMLSAFASYYEQLSDVVDTLRETAVRLNEKRAVDLWTALSERIKTLQSTVTMMAEYSVQLREMHDAQINMRQNEIMTVLTIVTVLFAPLTLIVGWYGMNFFNMPELTCRYGYAAVCVISILCVIAEILFFKRKKWF